MMNLGMDWSDIAKKNDPRFPKSHGLCAECGEEFDVSDMDDCEDCFEDPKTGITPPLCSGECSQLHNNKEHQDD